MNLLFWTGMIAMFIYRGVLGLIGGFGFVNSVFIGEFYQAYNDKCPAKCKLGTMICVGGTCCCPWVM